MKYVGAVKITADVTRIFPKRDGKKASEAFYQYAAFNRATGLFELLFSEPDAYQKLAARFEETLAERWKEDKIKELRAAFGRFCSCYEKKARADSLTEESDAFFVYLEVFGYQGLLTDSDRQIRNGWRGPGRR